MTRAASKRVQARRRSRFQKAAQRAGEKARKRLHLDEAEARRALLANPGAAVDVPVNAPGGSYLRSPDYHEAKAAGFDVSQKEWRRLAPPGCPWSRKGRDHDRPPDIDPKTGLVKPPSTVLLPPTDNAVWDWWQSLEPEARAVIYDASRFMREHVASDEPAEMQVVNTVLSFDGDDARRWGSFADVSSKGY